MPTTPRIYRPLRPLAAARPWLLLAALLLAGCVAATPPEIHPVPAGSGDLIVELSGLRNDHGVVLVSLFASAAGFPDVPERAQANLNAPLADGRATVTFARLPWGRYALSVLHDENGNGRMDTGLLGIPEEGHAASNNVARRFGAPNFEEAVFVFDHPRVALPITLRYEKRRQGPFGR